MLSAACSLIGLAYPAYCSFRVLAENEKDDRDPASTTQWLAYWIVYCTFNVIEAPLYMFLSFIPFYAELKLAFVLWLQLPQFFGAMWLYKGYLEPLFKEAKRSGAVEKLFAYFTQVTKRGISQEQIREATQWGKAKLATLQKKVAADDITQAEPPASKPADEKKSRSPKAE